MDFPFRRALSLCHIAAAKGKMPRDAQKTAVSGIVGAVSSLAAWQSSFGNNVQVWGWNNDYKSGVSQIGDVEVWTSPHWSGASFQQWDLRWLAPVWFHALFQSNFDVIHVHGDPNLLYAGNSTCRLLHLHTPVPDPLPKSYLRLIKRADGIICCSEFVRERFLRAVDFPRDRTYLVYNGANFVSESTSLHSPILDSLQLPTRQPVILYAGAIVPCKGLALLIHAFSHIQPAFPQAILLVAGSARLWDSPSFDTDEAYEQDLLRLARDINVIFLGDVPREEMPALYLRADVVAVPSVWDDPHPTVVCEAMAHGRPVVASRVGGIPETVVDLETGLLVEPGNTRELAEALWILVADRSLRLRMGVAAHHRAKAEFNWRRSAIRLLDIYGELLEQSYA